MLCLCEQNWTLDNMKAWLKNNKERLKKATLRVQLKNDASFSDIWAGFKYYVCRVINEYNDKIDEFDYYSFCSGLMRDSVFCKTQDA